MNTTTTSSTDKTVLVVDDEYINRMVISAILQQSGYTVLEAENGLDCLKILEENDSIDVVLLDIMMPRMTGYEVCEAIRKSRTTEELPIIFVTAKHIDAAIDECNNCGGNKVLAKPLRKAHLLECLSEFEC